MSLHRKPFVMCYKNHKTSRILKAVNLDSNPADSFPSSFKLLNISGLQTPHLHNEDNNRDDEESKMMMVVVRRKWRRGGGRRKKGKEK